MVDLSLLQSASYIAGALGVCIAAVFYVLNLRISRKNQELALKAQEQSLETRRAQLLMSIMNQWMTPEYEDKWQTLLWKMSWIDYEDKMMKYPMSSVETVNEASIWKFFESISVLMQEELIDVKVLSKLIAVDVIRFWEKFGPSLMEMRSRGAPELFRGAELLYQEMKKVSSLEWKF